MKLLLILLVGLFTGGAQAQKMSGAEASVRLEKFLGEVDLFKSSNGHVAYQVSSDFIMDIRNFSYNHEMKNKPGFWITFRRDEKRIQTQFGINFWQDRSDALVEVEETELRLTLKTTDRTMTLEKFAPGNWNDSLKSITISFSNGWTKTWEDTLRRGAGESCSVSLPGTGRHTMAGKNGSFSANYSPPMPATSFWSSLTSR